MGRFRPAYEFASPKLPAVADASTLVRFQAVIDTCSRERESILASHPGSGCCIGINRQGQVADRRRVPWAFICVGLGIAIAGVRESGLGAFERIIERNTSSTPDLLRFCRAYDLEMRIMVRTEKERMLCLLVGHTSERTMLPSPSASPTRVNNSLSFACLCANRTIRGFSRSSTVRALGHFPCVLASDKFRLCCFSFYSKPRTSWARRGSSLQISRRVSRCVRTRCTSSLVACPHRKVSSMHAEARGLLIPTPARTLCIQGLRIGHKPSQPAHLPSQPGPGCPVIADTCPQAQVELLVARVAAALAADINEEDFYESPRTRSVTLALQSSP